MNKKVQKGNNRDSDEQSKKKGFDYVLALCSVTLLAGVVGAVQGWDQKKPANDESDSSKNKHSAQTEFRDITDYKISLPKNDRILTDIDIVMLESNIITSFRNNGLVVDAAVHKDVIVNLAKQFKQAANEQGTRLEAHDYMNLVSQSVQSLEDSARFAELDAYNNKQLRASATFNDQSFEAQVKVRKKSSDLHDVQYVRALSLPYIR
jgi:hypothetical protein